MVIFHFFLVEDIFVGAENRIIQSMACLRNLLMGNLSMIIFFLGFDRWYYNWGIFLSII